MKTYFMLICPFEFALHFHFIIISFIFHVLVRLSSIQLVANLGMSHIAPT